MKTNAREAALDTATQRTATLGHDDDGVRRTLATRIFPSRSVAVLRIAVLGIALAACATLQNVLTFEKPQIELQEINVTGLGLSGGTLDLVFDVYNPNDYRLRSTRLEVGLELADTDFGEALIDKPLDLSPENHSRVVMPVRFTWSGVGAAARSLLESRELPYGLTGAVLLETPIGEKRVELKNNGTVPLRKLLN